MKKTQKNAKARSNSKTPEKIYLGWVEYLLLICDLRDMIKASGIKFDYIYGPCRGGYIPAVILSHEFNVPVVENEQDFQDIADERLSVLIVDDIIDTGETINDNIDAFGGHITFHTASLYKHKKCKYKPDFYVRENSKWICFPYEKE